MKLSETDLRSAADAGILSESQAGQLWEFLAARYKDTPRFDLANIAYYFGALVVIGAMGWFMTEAWEAFGGGGILSIATLYGAAFVLAGHRLWFRDGLRIPGGLLVTLAVCMAPLAIYGFQRMTGLWPDSDPGVYRDFHHWVRGGWALMEVGTVIAGAVALYFVRFPFLTAPIALALWYLSMDLAPILFGDEYSVWPHHLWVSLWFGLAMLVVAWLIDRRTRLDYAFWLYLFGAMAFWGGLTLMESDSELSKFFYCMINVVLMGVSLLLQRRVFMAFGAVGVFAYIGHLAHRVFADSLLFPFVLSLIGLLIIYLGIKYQRHQAAIDSTVQGWLPASLRASSRANHARIG